MKPHPFHPIIRTRLSQAIAILCASLAFNSTSASATTIASGTYDYADGTVITDTKTGASAYVIRATDNISMNAQGTLTLSATSDTQTQTINTQSGKNVSFTGNIININSTHTGNTSVQNNALGIISTNGAINFNNLQTNITVINNPNSTITTNGQTQGLFLSGANASLKVENDLNLNVYSGVNSTGNTSGLYIRTAGNATFNGNTNISVVNDTNMTGLSTTQMSIGVNMEQSGTPLATFNGDNTNITATANNKSSRAIGVLSYYPGDKVIFNGKNATIQAIASNDNATSGLATQRAGAEIIVNNTVENLTVRSEANILNATGNTGLQSNASGVVASYSGKINIHAKNTNISATAQDNQNNPAEVAAVRVYYTQADGNPVSSQIPSEINISGDTANIHASSNNGAASVYANGGNVSINNKTINISATGGTADQQYSLFAINTSNFANTNIWINSDTAGNSQGAVVTLNGNIYADNVKSTITANLDKAGSSLTGASILQNNGTINLTFDNRAIWNMTASSDVTNMKATGGSIIDMTADHAKNTVLTAGTLNGTGANFKMDTDFRNNDGDKIILTGSETGTHTVQVKDASLSTGVQNETGKLLIITDNGKNASFIGTDLYNGGLWKYTPEIISEDAGAATNWYIQAIKREATADTLSFADGADTVYSAWINNDTLRKRLGELRNTGKERGLWGRVIAGELKGNSIKNTYQTYQIGFDFDLPRAKDWIIGGAFEYSKGDIDYIAGDGKNKMKVLTLYGTHVSEKIGNIDIVAKHGWIDGHIRTNQFVDYGSYDTNATSIGVEYNKRMGLAKSFFVEPQAQLTYSHIASYGYTTDNGTHINTGSINSTVGRLGVLLGRAFDSAGSNLYIKASVLRDFTADTSVAMLATNNERYDADKNYKKTWYELGIGGNINIGKTGQFYMDVERSFSGDFKKQWQINAGLRYEF